MRLKSGTSAAIPLSAFRGITIGLPRRYQSDTVEEAVGYVVGWMETHPVEFEQDLTEFTGVSERTAEYLLLEHETKNHQQLYELWKESTLEAVVGKQWHDDLDEEMKEKFE